MEATIRNEMEKLDNKLIFGDRLNTEEVEFYNRHWQEMMNETQEIADHWRYHTSQI